MMLRLLLPLPGFPLGVTLSNVLENSDEIILTSAPLFLINLQSAL